MTTCRQPLRSAALLAAACLLAAGAGLGQGAASREVLSRRWFRLEFAPSARGVAVKLSTAADSASDRVRLLLGIGITDPITIVLVRSRDEMRREVLARAGIEPPDWAGGLTIASLRLVLIRSDLAGEEYDRIGGLLAHELTHMALADARREGAAQLPRWWEEGIAQWVAGRARPLEIPDLRPAATFGWLLPLDELTAAFGAGEGAASRAYAEAESFVRYLGRAAGPDAPRKITAALLDGTSFDAAVTVGSGRSLVLHWDGWQAELRADRGWMLEAGAQAVTAAALIALVVFATRRRLARRRAIESQWGDDVVPPPPATDGSGAAALGPAGDGVQPPLNPPVP